MRNILCIIILIFASTVFARFPSTGQVKEYSDIRNDMMNTYDFDDSTSTQVDTVNVKYIKRNYNHQEQIIVGSMIMSFFAILLVAMNNYNPKR
ncbi:MAG: hypothetical protein OCD01_15480 [Fibrobacterales bacterium]